MAIPRSDLRCNRMAACAECMRHKATCGGKNACAIAKNELRDYGGTRFTSDGFDCALPVSIDSHTLCSFGCLYCFTPNLIQGRNKTTADLGQTSLLKLEALFSGAGGHREILTRKALKYDKKVNGYPCPVQLGALCDPLDNIERNQGWFLKFAELVKKYNQPVRISTKGNLFLEDEYLDAVKDRPELFWVNFSIISADDDVIQKVDRRAPPTSERIECMRRLSEVGVKTGLRFRPIIAGISDATDNFPRAYADLITMAAKAGAKAISYEVVFLPKSMTPELKERWETIEAISNRPLMKIYRSFGKPEACMRPSHKWTEQIMHAIHKEAKAHNLTVGVSDPNWKQLTDTGCCCGILPDDPVFGNWQRESATNQLLLARDGIKPELRAKDIIPRWAYETPADYLLFLNHGVGPEARFKRKHTKWSDNLEELWNNMKRSRSPLKYFQGALMPVRTEGRQVIYKYVGLKRRHPEKTPYWDIREAKHEDPEEKI